MFICSMIPFLTEEMIEEDPYGSFVASATYIAVGARVGIEANFFLNCGSNPGPLGSFMLCAESIAQTLLTHLCLTLFNCYEPDRY